MRKLLTIFSLLLSLVTLGQSSFPVEVTNQFSQIPPHAYQGGYNNNAYSLAFITRSQIQSATSTSIGYLYSLNAGFAPQPGKAAVITSVSFTSTKPITVQGRIGIPVGPLNGVNVPERVIVATVDSGKVVTLPVNWVIRNGQQVTFYVLNLTKPTDTAAWVGCSPQVYYITDDFNWNARKTMAIYGTSISNGSGPSSTVNMYITKAKQYLRSQGASVRYELYGISGSTSSQHMQYAEKGAYDVTSKGTPPDIAVLEMAVNDASSGMAPATSVANYQRLCTYFLNHPENKNIRVLVLGSTPLQNNTASANAATLDAALLAMVNQFKSTPSYNGRIYFVPQSASFDRTNFSNFSSFDTPGSGIHPNDTGSGLIFSVSWMNWFSTSDGQQFITWAKK